jgi:hypothetical protein
MVIFVSCLSLEPFPTFRYSPCSQSFFSFAFASASCGRIATPRKNNFQNCGAVTAIWGSLLVIL